MATLQRGSSGPEVRHLQQRLNDLGTNPPLVTDGVFGAHTEVAVIAFQRTHGMEADGIVGPLTQAALGLATIAEGVTGRIRQVMDLLTSVQEFPANGAAGLVGNLQAESGVLPNRVQGSSASTPMRARNFAGVLTDFSADDIMNRNPATRVGPQLAGVGFAQWTAPARRAGLFQHVFNGSALGAAILFSVEAQLDFLATELTHNFQAVNNILRDPRSSLDAASDEVAYHFEVPAVVLDAGGHLLPRSDPHVQELFSARRILSRNALHVFEAAHA